MSMLRVYQVDAFTTERYQGNPAGVVANADGLGDAQMQLIARELNNSEIAAHYVLALERGAPATPRRQLTGAGVQTIEILPEGDDFRIAIRQNRPEFAPPLSAALAAEVAAALGTDADALDPRCPIQFVSTGHGKLLIGLRERARLQSLAPDAARLIALGPAAGSNGYFAFTLDAAPDDDALTWGRMFAPAIGIAEDPVTGNANGPLGAYLVRHGLLRGRDGNARYRARQVAGNGRGGFMDVDVRIENSEPVGVRIEGRAVVCFSTTLPREG